MNYYKFLVALSFSLVIFQANAQTIFDLNTRLGRGINYGNMFEAPSETEWGNQWQPEYPQIISELGFSHVRMPIRWEPDERSSAESPYTIESSFLARIKEVVDATLAEELLIVINMHHHHELFEDPENNKARFLAQWQQISTYFKDYPDDLVFEILNEPNEGITPEVWNEFSQDALNVIRIDNPTRAVLIGTAEWGGLGGLPKLELPEDDNIIVTIHYYNPFQFTHQEAEWVDGADAWTDIEWLDTDLEREVVESEFAYLRSFSAENNIPVHIGEFGAYSAADLVSRERWTTFLGRYFEEQEWSWAYWEFSAGFGIYDPDSETYVDELVDGLLHNEMPEPATYERTTIYQSDFNSDTDGWTLVANNGANAQLSRESNRLQVDISSVGSENWHIQLVKNGFSLEAGKKYSFSFDGSATGTRSVSNYMGMNADPWSQYGSTGVSLTSTEQSFSGVFDMTVSDAAARLVFDLGSSTENVTITNVKLEELELKTPPDPPLAVDERTSMRVYPNPTNGFLHINNAENYKYVTIFNVHGQVLVASKLKSGINTIDMQKVPKGLCFVAISGGSQRQVFKILHK